MNLFDRILKSRGITPETKAAFLLPKYDGGDTSHDPFLLPDMQAAVDRLVMAHKNQENITIYGDYDIDGLTATTLLIDALAQFGFEHVEAFIPNRFVEGYGLTVDAIERIAEQGAQLIITVDCGSLSHAEITRANELGVDVIVTDHHNVAPEQPPAVAVINPKRVDSKYPFIDLPGVGVAFKLVQALQTVLSGLEKGQEKWLLDLVALGTVCDVVTLVDENRTHVYWGLKVLAKTRRPGLKALMAVAGVRPETLNSRSLGFSLGPRMNAAGRLETAQHALNMLVATDPMEALKYARQLDEMNLARRSEQAEILKEAILQAETFADDSVLVVASEGWNHGIVGIVAAKLLEKYKKPTFVLASEGDTTKGSARSYGDFSAADAIRAAEAVITKGGGHKLAAGVTLPTANIELFRKQINAFYKGLKLKPQAQLLLPAADTTAELSELNEALVTTISQLEPFGNGNPQPILQTNELTVINQRRMGTDGQHVKLTLQSKDHTTIDMMAFSAPESFFAEPGEQVNVWYSIDINEWQGKRTVEGRLLHVEKLEV